MAAAPPIGSILAGKYRVERVLGRGGMGVVVAARHLRLRERVAIKLLFAGAAAPSTLVARFVREGRAAMRIRSEHVVRVHDVATLETGEPYLVMEYLQGSDLAAVLRRDGPLPVPLAVECVLQAIEALAEAHARGMIHRDVKPGNLFLSRRADGSPVVKVLDFGIAKDTAADATGVESVGAIGTPLYMAPEQMRGGLPIDARTDVWGLGATLHALLTGAAPFGAGTLVEIHERVLRGPAPLVASGADVPEALQAILLRCLAPDPSDRYPDVAALAQALAEVAPEHARISAERATRILGGAALEPDSHGGDDEETVLETGEGAPSTGPGEAPSWSDGAPGEASTESPATASLVARIGLAPPARTWWRALPLLAAGVAGALVIAAFARGSGPAPAPRPAATAVMVTTAASAASAAAPEVGPEARAEAPARPPPAASVLPADARIEGTGAPPGGSPPRLPSSGTPTATPAPRQPPRDRAGGRAPAPAGPPPAAGPPRDPLADPD